MSNKAIADNMKITGTIETTDANYNVHHGAVNLRLDLSLRDLFAAFALAGLMLREPMTVENTAKQAYLYADAMPRCSQGKEGTDEQ